MLSTILKSSIATKVSISIMDAFVAMRKYISDNLLEQNYIKDMIIRHDEEIKILQNTFYSSSVTCNNLVFCERNIIQCVCGQHDQSGLKLV